jgi:hypothetical protein
MQGRAYPTVSSARSYFSTKYTNLSPWKWHQTTANVYDISGKGVKMLPSVVSSGDGNIVVWEHFLSRFLSDSLTGLQVMTKAKRDVDVDALLRAACVEMG